MTMRSSDRDDWGFLRVKRLEIMTNSADGLTIYHLPWTDSPAEIQADFRMSCDPRMPICWVGIVERNVAGDVREMFVPLNTTGLTVQEVLDQQPLLSRVGEIAAR